MIARERSLPTDRLFPFGRGLRGGGFMSTQLQGGRGARLRVDPDFASLNPGTACYSLRDADLPPAPGEYARGGLPIRR
jgi:hypothetical protein